jgi:hypothetical protein
LQSCYEQSSKRGDQVLYGQKECLASLTQPRIALWH